MKAIKNFVLISLLFINYTTSKSQQIQPRRGKSVFDEVNNTINDILNSQLMATDSALKGVNAYSDAVATCSVNVSCDEAKRRYGKTETYVNIASIAFSESVAAAKATKNATADKAIPAESLRSSQESAELAAKQSGFALQATATALASCEVILHLVCEQCPTGVEVPETTASRANKIIQSIKNQLKDFI